MSRVEHYTEDLTGDTFRVDSLVQDAVIYNLGVIGKVATEIERNYPDFAASHAHVRWTPLHQTCDRIAREYFSFDAT
ncbi:HepT-like ribonuclease domain-containing protein [Paraburkholderia diazotrophica]|uniref:HepT-like ribonuclease domain-containing protein n=1 Tax=Paraburkholderia diazotrophica TaxID=667676 RepID=UPI00319E1C85